mmetsp:Transcript_8544/g.26821  ORF Transcript_8544/g.26821 Transcript_8544/m.26821 type:complete len:383 (-) Transcript_8544:1482-2630(-)
MQMRDVARRVDGSVGGNRTRKACMALGLGSLRQQDASALPTGGEGGGGQQSARSAGAGEGWPSLHRPREGRAKGGLRVDASLALLDGRADVLVHRVEVERLLEAAPPRARVLRLFVPREEERLQQPAEDEVAEQHAKRIEEGGHLPEVVARRGGGRRLAVRRSASEQAVDQASLLAASPLRARGVRLRALDGVVALCVKDWCHRHVQEEEGLQEDARPLGQIVVEGTGPRVHLDEHELLHGGGEEQRGAADEVEDRGRGRKDEHHRRHLEHVCVPVGEAPHRRLVEGVDAPLRALEAGEDPHSDDPAQRDHLREEDEKHDVRDGDHNHLRHHPRLAVPVEAVETCHQLAGHLPEGGLGGAEGGGGALSDVLERLAQRGRLLP